MSTSNSIRHAVRYALLTSAAAAAAGPAYGADSTIQEVVVTGSRIAQPNLETTSPVTQVTAEDIAVQGVTRVEDLINQLPQAFAAQNASVSNGATGTATVNLRGLGAPRTLVLVDGRRMPYGGVSSASAAADLNQIPAAMVERVEVLTGGASAVYGSDAIGGVVNFIMKKDFEGVQFDASTASTSTTTTSAVRARSSCATRSAADHATESFAVRPARRQRDRRRGSRVQRHDGCEHRRRSRQHHGVRRRARQQAKCCSETATTRPAR